MNKIIPATIISGFPGIGKTVAAKKFPTFIRDLESSDYHWTTQKAEDGSSITITHPEWPYNYLKQIRALDTSKYYKVVCVCSSAYVRSAMRAAGIKYVNIYPEDSPEMFDLMIKRYESRNDTEKFILDMKEHWHAYIKSMEDDEGAIRKLKLGPDNINEWVTMCMYA